MNTPHSLLCERRPLSLTPVPLLLMAWCLAGLFTLTLSAHATSDVLWDQSDYTQTPTNRHGGGSWIYSDGIFTEERAFRDRIANYVSFDRPVVIHEIASYISFLDYHPSRPLGEVAQVSPVGEGPFLAGLVLRPATTGNPETDIDWIFPQDFIAVSVTLTPVGENYQVTASGLNIALDPGDYWIGVMPEYGFLGSTSPDGPPIRMPYHLQNQVFSPPTFAWQFQLPSVPFPDIWRFWESDQTPAIKISGTEWGNDDYANAVLASGPVLYWDFEEDGVEPAQERVTGTLDNVLVPQNGATRASSLPGLGLAASFDGASDNAGLQPRFTASTLSLGGPTVFDHYAVEMWVKLTTGSGIQYLLEASDGSNTNAPALIHGFETNAGAPAFEYFTLFGRTGGAGPTVLNDNQWHHIVVEANVPSDTHTIYIDGALVLQTSGTSPWRLPILGVGATGVFDGLHGTNGLIDELAFYDLSSGPTTGPRIASHYYVMFPATSVPPAASTPTRMALHANIPNPFNPSTTIRFDLPQAGKIELTIYDVAGRRVRTLLQESMPAGSHEVLWHGVDDSGRQVASGVYLYRLSVGSQVETRRMTLLK